MSVVGRLVGGVLGEQIGRLTTVHGSPAGRIRHE